MKKRRLETVDTIVIHCSATKPDHDVSLKDIRRWHKAKGWADVGYHFVVLPDGTIEEGREITRQGAHVRGHNVGSIGICYIGGLNDEGKPADTITPEQVQSIANIIDNCCLSDVYSISRLLGHRDFPNVNKACPCFDVGTKFFAEILIHQLNAS